MIYAAVASAGEAEPVRDGGGLTAVGYAELGEDVGDVDAGGLVADEQRLGDLAVGAAVGDQHKHLALPRGEAQLVGHGCGLLRWAVRLTLTRWGCQLDPRAAG